MSVQTEAAAAERRANLLAGLNDAPSALIGWDVVEGPAIRLRDGRLLERRRWQRADNLWSAYRGARYAEKVRTDQAERYFALTGKRLPDPHLQMKSPMTALDALGNFREALEEAARPILKIVNGIMDALSGTAFPRLEVADLSQDDVVKGA